MTSLLQLKCRNCAWKLITSHLCQQLTASRHMEARRRTSGRGQTGLISSGRKHQVQSYILLPWRIHHPVPTRLCDTILIVCSWKYDKSIDIALRCRYNKRSTCAKKYWHFSFPWWSIFSGLLPPRERERPVSVCVVQLHCHRITYTHLTQLLLSLSWSLVRNIFNIVISIS